MSSMGVFRKVDLDGTSYWIYTSPHKTLAMSTGGTDHHSFQHLFSCPSSCIKLHKVNLKKDGHDLTRPQPFDSSFHFPRSGDQGSQPFLDRDDDDPCKLPVVPLFWCNNEEPDYDLFNCGACSQSVLSTGYYTCLGCEEKFHKGCVESPLEIKHPSHPFHALRLHTHDIHIRSCVYCEGFVSNFFYHCSTCDLTMHPICAMKTIPFVFNHPKSHHHPLTFFPAQASLVCNFCAMIKKLDPTYICIQCVFVIHENCIGFPHVIRIPRHKHRISFTLSLPSGNLSCGVCREQVDNNYGAYSCKICDAYFVHSKCALHKDVWDEKELEGVPEEEDIIDDGEPFKRIADGIILHPFHSHQLRLENLESYDITKYCQGCALPTSEDQFYSCKDCDFIIHESCANAPLMIRHPSYPHPLTLCVPNAKGTFGCTQCFRDGNGFFYEYRKEKEIFRLDLRCASIIEPFKYEGHEHSLFLAWSPEKRIQCQMCKYNESHLSMLICLQCHYTICTGCVALPYKVKYKYDNHLLTICDGKEASDEPDWCENCECKIEEVKETGYRGIMSRKIERRYYKCNDYCSTALHVDCLLGIDMFMKPGNTEKDYISFFKYSFESEFEERRDVMVLLNNSVSRPVCTGCERRCPFPIVFKGYNATFCSWNCIGYDIW